MVEMWELAFSEVMAAIQDFKLNDLVDIILISYLIFKATKLVRETRAEQLVKGILLLAISYFLADVFVLKTMTFMLKNVFQIGIIALIVLFQPELRRALEKVGRTKVVDFGAFGGDSSEKKVATWSRSIDKLCKGVFNLSETKTGALIVIELRTKLGEQILTCNMFC